MPIPQRNTRKPHLAKTTRSGALVYLDFYYNTGVDYMGVQLSEVFHVAYLAADYIGLTRLPKKGAIVTSFVNSVTSVRV